MRWPWLRSEKEIKEEADEADKVRIRLQLVMEDLRRTLDDAEQAIQQQAIQQRAIERSNEDGR